MGNMKKNKLTKYPNISSMYVILNMFDNIDNTVFNGMTFNTIDGARTFIVDELGIEAEDSYIIAKLMPMLKIECKGIVETKL
jgi:hypothetical protein